MGLYADGYMKPNLQDEVKGTANALLACQKDIASARVEITELKVSRKRLMLENAELRKLCDTRAPGVELALAKNQLHEVKATLNALVILVNDCDFGRKAADDE